MQFLQRCIVLTALLVCKNAKSCPAHVSNSYLHQTPTSALYYYSDCKNTDSSTFYCKNTVYSSFHIVLWKETLSSTHFTLLVNNRLHFRIGTAEDIAPVSEGSVIRFKLGARMKCLTVQCNEKCS